MSDQERGFEYMPTYPSHEDDDVYDYIYILTYDFTVDPITMYWRFDRKIKKRKVLGDLTREEAAKRRRRVPDRLPTGRQNMDVQEENQMRSGNRRRRNTDLDLSEGI